MKSGIVEICLPKCQGDKELTTHTITLVGSDGVCRNSFPYHTEGYRALLVPLLKCPSVLCGCHCLSSHMSFQLHQQSHNEAFGVLLFTSLKHLIVTLFSKQYKSQPSRKARWLESHLTFEMRDCHLCTVIWKRTRAVENMSCTDADKISMQNNQIDHYPVF